MLDNDTVFQGYLAKHGIVDLSRVQMVLQGVYM